MGSVSPTNVEREARKGEGLDQGHTATPQRRHTWDLPVHGCCPEPAHTEWQTQRNPTARTVPAEARGGQEPFLRASLPPTSIKADWGTTGSGAWLEQNPKGTKALFLSLKREKTFI